MPILSCPALAAPFLAQAAAPATRGGDSLFTLLTMGLLFAGMWFLLIAPQRKRQKEHQKMMDSLQSGDEIITTGGLFGTIANVKPDRFVLKLADGTKVELSKGFVHAKVTEPAREKTSKEK